VLVDDGSCPAGQIKQVIGGQSRQGWRHKAHLANLQVHSEIGPDMRGLCTSIFGEAGGTDAVTSARETVVPLGSCGRWRHRVKRCKKSCEDFARRSATLTLSISKRTLSRLIARRKIVARKDGVRTLVDVASLKAYYEALPLKSHHAPLVFGRRAHVVPCTRRMARR
jgi:hypothetical protein